MIEEILLEHLFFCILIHDFLELFDGIYTRLDDVPVKSRFERIPVREQNEKLVDILDIPCQLFGRSSKLHSLERHDAMLIHDFPIVLLIEWQCAQLRDECFGTLAKTRRK